MAKLDKETRKAIKKYIKETDKLIDAFDLQLFQLRRVLEDLLNA